MSSRVTWIALGTSLTALVLSGLNFALYMSAGPASDVAALPSGPQCVAAIPPKSVIVGSESVFRATLCIDDGTEVDIYYRPLGAVEYTSKHMPKRLGTYTAKVEVTERFKSGVEYWIQAGGTTAGSGERPLTALITE